MTSATKSGRTRVVAVTSRRLQPLPDRAPPQADPSDRPVPATTPYRAQLAAWR